MESPEHWKVSESELKYAELIKRERTLPKSRGSAFQLLGSISKSGSLCKNSQAEALQCNTHYTAVTVGARILRSITERSCSGERSCTFTLTVHEAHGCTCWHSPRWLYGTAAVASRSLAENLAFNSSHAFQTATAHTEA